MPGLGLTDHESIGEQVETAAQGRARNPEGARRLGAVPGLSVNVRDHGPHALEHDGRNANADVFSADPFERDSSGAAPSRAVPTRGRGRTTSSSPARRATTVAATLNLRLKSAHDLSGGYAGHGGQASAVQVLVQVAQAFYPNAAYGQVTGDYAYTNEGPFSSGVLTGMSGSITNFPFTLSATLPVNVPFAVELRVVASGTGYGNYSTNPGSSTSDAGSPIAGPLDTGLMLDDVSGQVITMPAGYTLNAPSWGIANNVVGVGDVSAPARMRLANAGANPFTREARVALDLPQAGRVRIAVFGVTGRVVRTLVDAWMPAGRHDLVWDGRGAQVAAVPSGLYFVRAECGQEQVHLRVVRIP